MRCILCIAALASIGACATLDIESDGYTFEQRQQQLLATPNWQMRGRISVDTGADAYQGRFTWLQNEDVLSLLIRGPLGAGGVSINGTADELILRARGESRVMHDAETDLSELLGWWLPISSLRHWLLGLPDERFDHRDATVASELLSALNQRGWQLDYASYSQEESLLIPSRIELARAPLTLIVTIDSWRPITPALAGP